MTVIGQPAPEPASHPQKKTKQAKLFSFEGTSDTDSYLDPKEVDNIRKRLNSIISASSHRLIPPETNSRSIRSISTCMIDEEFKTIVPTKMVPFFFNYLQTGDIENAAQNLDLKRLSL